MASWALSVMLPTNTVTGGPLGAFIMGGAECVGGAEYSVMGGGGPRNMGGIPKAGMGIPPGGGIMPGRGGKAILQKWAWQNTNTFNFIK